MNGMTLRRLGLADQHDSRQGNGSVMMKLYIMTVISIVPNKMTKKKNTHESSFISSRDPLVCFHLELSRIQSDQFFL